MANIGNLAVTLSLDAAAFAAGLQAAGNDLGGFAGKASSTLAAVSAGAAAFGAVGDAAEAAFAWMKDGVDQLADVGREAQRLNLSTEALSALQLKAGRSADVLESSLRHLNLRIAEAGVAGSEAQLALKGFGLDGAALARMGGDQALQKIADKFAGLTSAADRLRLAKDLFPEREAAAFLNILDGGSAGLKAAAENAKKLGVSVSTIDAANAVAAQTAMDNLGKSLQGIQRSFAAEFAPVITDVANGLTDMVAKAGGGRAIFKELAEGAASFLVTVLDGVEGIAVFLADVSKNIKDVVTQGKALKTGGLGMLGVQESPQWVNNWAATFKEAFDPGSTMKGAGNDWGKSVKDVLDPLIKGIKDHGSQSAVEKLFADLSKLGKGGDAADSTRDLETAIGKLELKLHDQVAAFGMAGEAAERFALAHKGATDAQLAGVDAALAQLAALREIDESVGRGLNIWQQQEDKIKNLNVWTAKSADNLAGFAAEYAKLTREMSKKIDAEALKVFEETASPLDKFKANLDDLDHLLALHKINAQQYAAAVAKDFEGIGAMSSKVEHSGAALEGSKEAFQAILKAEDQDRPGDVQQRIEAAVKQLVKQQEAAERTNQAIADAINRIFKKGN